MVTTTKTTTSRVAAAVALTLLAGAAQAHPGHIGAHDASNMFMLGFWHPMTGADHLLAMLTVGLWSALTHRTLREAIALPAVFVALLLVGAMLGLSGFRLPAVEPLILASVLVLGLLVAARQSLPRSYSFVLVGLFAIFHGLAHGMELPPQGSAALFVAGFVSTTLILHLIGLFVGFKLKAQRRWVSGALGAGIAGYAGLLLIGL